MKKTIVMTMLCILTGELKAQNTFPSTGNVGIGTTSPSAALEINSGTGVTPLKAVGPNGYILVDNVGSGQSYYKANNGHYFQGAAGTNIFTLMSNGSASFVGSISAASFSGNLTGTSSNSTLWNNVQGALYTDMSYLDLTGIVGMHANGNAYRVNLSNIKSWLGLGSNAYTSTSYAPLASPIFTGSVGIGTTTPNAGLDVWNGAVHVVGGYAGNYSVDGAYVGWNRSGGSGETNFVNNIGGGAGGFTFDNVTRSSVFTRLMTITSEGKVGIGTTSPNVNLQVNSLNTGSGTNNWIAGNFGGQSGDRVVMGLLYGVATIGSHNNALNAWSNLAINVDGGNVGIGTSSPSYKFNVAQDITMNNDIDAAQLGISGRTDNAKRLIFGYDINGAGFGYIKAGWYGHQWTNLVLQPNGGNVGIGTSNPENSEGWEKALDVYGADDSKILASTNQIHTGMWSHEGGFYGAPPGGIIGTYSNHPFSVITNKTAKMTILPTGYVGIGTTSPDAQLAVNGTVHAKAVTVDLNGFPDYVFKNNYNLTSLSDLKTYIDKNHHLPEVPSEKEVAEKGLNLGEMNKILVKKVEELTLYLIEKDKKEKAQEDRINKLEQEVGSLLKIVKQ